MGFLSKLFGGSAGELVDAAGGLIDKIDAAHMGKKEFQIELQRMVAERDQRIMTEVMNEVNAKRDIMVAELQHGDPYTKRARPTVIYSGLFVVAATIVGSYLGKEIAVPADYWYVWGAVCMTYVLGRSYEKGANGKEVPRSIEMITGTKRSHAALLD